MFNLFPIPVPDLGGRTVLVTGAGRGIGAELVRVLVARGARVFAGVRSTEGDPPEELPAEATAFELDVTRQDDAERAVQRVREEVGRLDALVNNAGVIDPIGHLETLPSDSLMPAFAVNVGGVHRMAVAALPLLKESRGTIVNAGTGAASTAMEGWTAYCTSKAAMLMLSRMMELELGPLGIRTFFLGIPPVDTAMQAAIRKAGLNPISRIAQGDLVATAVPASVMAYLCSAEARDAVDELQLDIRQPRFTDMMAERR